MSGFVNVWASGEGGREEKHEGKIFFFPASTHPGEEDASVVQNGNVSYFFFFFFLEERKINLKNNPKMGYDISVSFSHR